MRGMRHQSYSTDGKTSVEWIEIDHPYDMGASIIRAYGKIGEVRGSDMHSKARVAGRISCDDLAPLMEIEMGDEEEIEKLKVYIKEKLNLTDKELDEELIKERNIK